ncbi:hypothetical protein AYL99_11168 [Fonsecaea erecta]|uniref:Uncharacterized protein n=1 Tax=Fonsecaea erecta TaxID=1367422 RepID=A0A178Z4N4_9EURO|nr:hypothetical protein AYL99_11168 [Fonsecaea erecta]OAP54720.1 hypothetical protein AYL99_11168 [Fonsecaea erecta]
MQGFNMGRYVPPDLEGVVSFNTASGKGHALGSRARKLKTEGVLTVRFECPFAIWCTHCRPEQLIGQGVRFNAEKKKVGSYFSTPVWSFRFKHPVCGGWLEVRTDPQHAEYVVVEGGRRRDTGAEKVLDGEIRIAGPGGGNVTEEDKARLERDGGFGALEKKVQDKTLFDSQKERLESLLQASERDWADPYERSRQLRAEFRVGRRKRQADEKSGEALKEKFGLALDVVGEHAEDGERAKFIEFGEHPDLLSTTIATSSSSRKPMFRHVLDGDGHLGGPPSSSTPSSLSLLSSSSYSSAATAASRSKSTPATKRDPDHYKKDILQSTLRSNTRIATDPFLRGEEEGDIWQKPRVKRKRRGADEEDGGETEHNNRDRHEDKYEDTEKRRETNAKATAKAGNSTALALVVGYDSDSS